MLSKKKAFQIVYKQFARIKATCNKVESLQLTDTIHCAPTVSFSGHVYSPFLLRMIKNSTQLHRLGRIVSSLMKANDGFSSVFRLTIEWISPFFHVSRMWRLERKCNLMMTQDYQTQTLCRSECRFFFWFDFPFPNCSRRDICTFKWTKVGRNVVFYIKMIFCSKRRTMLTKNLETQWENALRQHERGTQFEQITLNCCVVCRKNAEQPICKSNFTKLLTSSPLRMAASRHFSLRVLPEVVPLSLNNEKKSCARFDKIVRFFISTTHFLTRKYFPSNHVRFTFVIAPIWEKKKN